MHLKGFQNNVLQPPSWCARGAVHIFPHVYETVNGPVALLGYVCYHTSHAYCHFDLSVIFKKGILFPLFTVYQHSFPLFTFSRGFQTNCTQDLGTPLWLGRRYVNASTNCIITTIRMQNDFWTGVRQDTAQLSYHLSSGKPDFETNFENRFVPYKKVTWIECLVLLTLFRYL